MRGLGDAILCAESFIDDEPFAVLLGDDVIYNEQKSAMQQLMQACEKLGSSVVACQKLTRAQIVPRNILQGVTTSRDGIYRFLDMEKEKGEDVVGKRRFWAATSLHRIFLKSCIASSPGKTAK